MKRFHLITLGCAKNEVDSDVLASSLIKSGFIPVSDPSDSDFVIVNTCSFIQDAVDESLRIINDLAQLKADSDSDTTFKLVVTGCLVDRFKEKSRELADGVDFWVPGNLQPELPALLGRGLPETFTSVQFQDQTYIYKDRALGSFINRSYTYIKVSEGCNRPCSFCIIPKIRGKFRSRPVDQILREAERLLEQGFKELILVAQDLSNYGADLYGRPSLDNLLVKLSDIKGDFWIRLLYVYPLGLSESLLDAITGCDKVVKYIDIPFQHSSERMLMLMRRPGGKYSPRRIVDMIRSKSEDIAIRTTFIVGHPGESEDDFQDLVKFVQEYQLDNVGVFCYSDEPESHSFSLDGKVSATIAQARRGYIMRLQRQISSTKLRKHVGKTIRVLVDGKIRRKYAGRAYFQAPEIDGLIYIDALKLNVGSFINCEIQESSAYDLHGKPKALALV